MPLAIPINLYCCSCAEGRETLGHFHYNYPALAKPRLLTFSKQFFGDLKDLPGCRVREPLSIVNATRPAEDQNQLGSAPLVLPVFIVLVGT